MVFVLALEPFVSFKNAMARHGVFEWPICFRTAVPAQLHSSACQGAEMEAARSAFSPISHCFNNISIYMYIIYMYTLYVYIIILYNIYIYRYITHTHIYIYTCMQSTYGTKRFWIPWDPNTVFHGNDQLFTGWMASKLCLCGCCADLARGSLARGVALHRGAKLASFGWWEN